MLALHNVIFALHSDIACPTSLLPPELRARRAVKDALLGVRKVVVRKGREESGREDKQKRRCDNAESGAAASPFVLGAGGRGKNH